MELSLMNKKNNPLLNQTMQRFCLKLCFKEANNKTSMNNFTFLFENKTKMKHINI